MRISWLESSIEGGGPAPYIDADTANAARVEEHRETRVEKLIEEMVATRGRILELMGRLQPEHLDFGIERTGPPPRTERLGDFLSDMSAHDIEHAEELQQVASRRVLAPDPLP